jgi:hypothetical protein
MRFAWFAVTATVATSACGGDGGGSITASMSFVVTTKTGSGGATIDPLYMNTFAIDVTFPSIDYVHGDESDSADCKSTVFVSDPATRVAHGDMAGLITTEILDKLSYWDIRLQLCTQGTSTVLLHSEIAALNLAFGCSGLPESAKKRDSAGWPVLTSFTATGCNATIYDVAVNSVLSNPNHELVFKTDPAEVP